MAPASFTGLDRFIRPSVFVPLGMAQRLGGEPADPLEDRGRHDLVVKGRLSAGASLESAQAELATIGAALEREYVKTNRNRRMAIRTELQRRIQQSPQLLALAKMLMGLVALILIIACSNVANLLLARARARSREIAIRLSIGAGRSRVVRQLMTESLIVAMAGGVAGLFVAYGGILLLNTLSVPSDPPNVLGVQLDWRVVEFSLLAALGSCILFGLAPAWQTARTDFVSALKTGGDGASGQRRTFVRDVLVAGQIALAMVVLIAAGMFLAGFRNILVKPPEFRTDHLISLDTAPAVLHYSPEQTKAFYRRLVDRVRTMAGVAASSDDRGAAAVAFADRDQRRARGLPVPEGPRKNDRVRRRCGRRLLQHPECRNHTWPRLHGPRPRRIALGGDCEPAVCEDLLGRPRSDRKADPAGQRERPGRRSGRSGEDRALSGCERSAGSVRVCALRAKPALADDVNRPDRWATRVRSRSPCATRFDRSTATCRYSTCGPWRRSTKAA